MQISNPRHSQRFLIGITGATGMLFLQAFLQVFGEAIEKKREQNQRPLLHGIISPSGEKVLKMETGLSPEKLPTIARWFASDDFTAAPASGSAGYQAMAILPCTMGTLGAIAGGISGNLIQRAADVTLKERKRLLLAVRETPLNRTHLTNMLSVHDAGGIICPTMPSYYFRPKTLHEAAETYAWRLLDQLAPHLEVADRRRWGE